MKKNVITCILIVTTIILIVIGKNASNLFSSETYARYKAAAEVNSMIEIAVPILEDTVETFTIPLEEMIPGSIKNYTFMVKNYNDDSIISDTSMNYRIEVENTEYIPITVELQKDNNETNILTNNVSPAYTLSHSNEDFDIFNVRITWDESTNDYRFSDLVEAIIIRIEGEQKID